jgi:23S rRNA pseudouridine1911/1915/1917 synthase
MSTSLQVNEDTAGQRLDVFCTSQMPGYSRSALQKAIKEGKVLVNGTPVKSRYILKANDTIVVNSDVPVEVKQSAESIAAIKIPILYEDRDVVVINKPAGITVHAGVGTTMSGTVSDWFSARYPDAREVGDEGRAGIVHRLDKDTSGVMILAKNENAYIHLKEQFQARRVRKEYLALVFGVPGGKDGRITRPLMRSRRNPMRRTVVDEKDLATLKLRKAHKEAATEWQVERKFGSSYALLRVLPFTGRTHQIRVHLHFLGYPIVGDQLYTFKRKKQPQGVKRQLLHAEKLTIELPNEKRKTFTAPLAEDFDEVVRTLSYH